MLDIDSKIIAGDSIAKGLPDEAINYLKARHTWGIDLTADDIMNTHSNYHSIAHNMPEDLPRCLFEGPSFFFHANTWNHAQLDSKEAMITTWAHKLKETFTSSTRGLRWWLIYNTPDSVTKAEGLQALASTQHIVGTQ